MLPAQFCLFSAGCSYHSSTSHHGRFREGSGWTRRQCGAACTLGIGEYGKLFYRDAGGPYNCGICPVMSSGCVEFVSPPGFYDTLAAGPGEDTRTSSSCFTRIKRACSDQVFLIACPAITSGYALVAIIPCLSHLWFNDAWGLFGANDWANLSLC